MLALSWILGLTLLFCIVCCMGYLLDKQVGDKGVKISKHFTGKEVVFSLVLAIVGYSGVMLITILPLPREEYKMNKTITFNHLESEFSSYSSLFRDNSSICWGNSEAREVVRNKADVAIESYKAKLGADLYKHNNDKVDIFVTSEHSNCFKYFFCGGVDNLYTADVTITDITKTYNFTGIITQQVYGGKKVYKVGELYLDDTHRSIDEKYLNKSVEVDLAYSELNSEGGVISEFDLISAKEVS